MIRGKAALRSGWYTESYVARALLNHVAHVSAQPFPAGVQPPETPTNQVVRFRRPISITETMDRHGLAGWYIVGTGATNVRGRPCSTRFALGKFPGETQVLRASPSERRKRNQGIYE